MCHLFTLDLSVIKANNHTYVNVDPQRTFSNFQYSGSLKQKDLGTTGTLFLPVPRSLARYLGRVEYEVGTRGIRSLRLMSTSLPTRVVFLSRVDSIPFRNSFRSTNTLLVHYWYSSIQRQVTATDSCQATKSLV